jgi:hypothetical protein
MVGFPLLLIPLAVYNIIVFLMPGVSLAEPVARLTLMSGAEWPVTLSDMLLALGIFLLLLEVIKGARPGAKYVTDHLLSLIVFGAAAAEFLLWPKFATSTYFLLTMFALVDFLSGIALRVRRGRGAPAVAVSRPAAPAPETALPEPQAPATEPPLPAAASVVESVPLERPEPKLDRPEPKFVPADPALAGPSLELAAPRVQPGDGSSSSPDADAPPR